MDAVGLASSIISFIDIAYKIVRGSYEVYKSAKSGEPTQQNAHVGLVVANLQNVAIKLQGHAKDVEDRQLQELSKKCCDLSEELIILLRKFLPKGPSPLHSFAAACRMLKEKKEVAALGEQLDRYRQQISQHLIMLIL